MINSKIGYSKWVGTICWIFLAGTLVFSGCTSDEEEAAPAGPNANEVWMQNVAFSPATRTVPVNTTVLWINKDNFNHNVVSDSGLFNSGIIAAGTTFSRQFTVPGTYPYDCTLHANMSGTIIVQ